MVSLIAIPSSAEGQREISRVNTPDIEPAELVPFTPARELQPETDRQNQRKFLTLFLNLFFTEIYVNV